MEGRLMNLLTRSESADSVVQAMEPTYNSIGKPGIFRNDRFWLAADHRVEPKLYHVPQIRALIDTAETAKNSFKMTEYQGLNVSYTSSTLTE
jgi:hypothetical protein